MSHKPAETILQTSYSLHFLRHEISLSKPISLLSETFHRTGHFTNNQFQVRISAIPCSILMADILTEWSTHSSRHSNTSASNGCIVLNVRATDSQSPLNSVWDKTLPFGACQCGLHASLTYITPLQSIVSGHWIACLNTRQLMVLQFTVQELRKPFNPTQQRQANWQKGVTIIGPQCMFPLVMSDYMQAHTDGSLAVVVYFFALCLPMLTSIAYRACHLSGTAFPLKHERIRLMIAKAKNRQTSFPTRMLSYTHHHHNNNKEFVRKDTIWPGALPFPLSSSSHVPEPAGETKQKTNEENQQLDKANNLFLALWVNQTTRHLEMLIEKHQI